MPCYRPLLGYRARYPNPDTGKYSTVFNAREGWLDMPRSTACGQCIGCRLAKSRQWGVRIMHQSSIYARNSFLTLTYDDRHMPKTRSLQKEHFQTFIKDLRAKIQYEERELADDQKTRIKYYHCGEYGEQLGRPHYHACLLNFDPPDKLLHAVSNGQNLYTSEYLSKIWKKGFILTGDLTFESAAYVARYVTKKITGDKAPLHYGNRLPEYSTMSNGIGKDWFEQFKRDVFPNDFVLLKGHKMIPPKYYSNLMEKQYPSEFREIKYRREQKNKVHTENQTPARLRVREICHEAKAKKLVRTYDNGNSSNDL